MSGSWLLWIQPGSDVQPPGALLSQPVPMTNYVMKTIYSGVNEQYVHCIILVLLRVLMLRSSDRRRIQWRSNLLTIAMYMYA